MAFPGFNFAYQFLVGLGHYFNSALICVTNSVYMLQKRKPSAKSLYSLF